MRDLRLLDANRIEHSRGGWGDSECGAFLFQRPTGNLRVIASAGEGWDHVSVSLANRCPGWAEMEWVKRKFFEDDEVAVQYHVAVRDHINCHPYTLHIWRKHGFAYPLPPKEFV